MEEEKLKIGSFPSIVCCAANSVHTLPWAEGLADGQYAVNGAVSGSTIAHSEHMQVLHRLVKPALGQDCVYDKRRQHRKMLGKVSKLPILACLCKTHHT